MKTINDIIKYVTYTPWNINKTILRQFLTELAEATSVISEDEFIKALQNGGNVYINDSFTIDDNITVDKDTRLNLNGHTIDCGTKQIQVNGGNLILEGEGTIISTKRGVGVYDGKLIIDGPTVTSTTDCAVVATGENAEVTFNSGLITAQEVGILATSGAAATMNGGTIQTTDNFCIGGNGTHGRGNTTITINGGKLEGHITSEGYVACGIYHPQDGTLNVNGGEIEAINGCGILMRAGILNMSGGTVIGSGESGMKGKVGDSKVTVGPNGIIYDQSAHYPDNQNLEVNVTGGTVIGIDASIDVLKDEGHQAKVTVSGSVALRPPYAE